MQRPGQKDIAKSLGISQATVSAVLNENRSIKISEATRKRVLDEADRVGYWPNRAASALLSRKTSLVSIIHIGNYLQTQMEKVARAVSAVEAQGYTPLIHEIIDGVKNDYICQYMRDAKVEGVFIVNASQRFMEESFPKYLKGVIPTVAIDLPNHPELPRFHSNRRQGFRILAEHLVKVGYQKIGVLCSQVDPIPEVDLVHSYGLEHGVRDALEQAGLEPPAIQRYKGASWKNPYLAGRSSMAELLNSGRRPEAVVCPNDAWAIGAMSECLHRGMRLPEDMAFTGFHNEVQSEYAPSPLTTAQTPLEELIPKAVAHLTDWLKHDGGPVIPSSLTMMDCRIIVRSSCGAYLQNATASSPSL